MPSDTSFPWMQRVRAIAGSARKSSERRSRQNSLTLQGKTASVENLVSFAANTSQGRGSSESGISHRPGRAFHHSFSHLETPALKLRYFLQKIVRMDHAPTEEEFSKMKFTALSMLKDLNSGDCRMEGLDSDNLDSFLQGCTDSFRLWAEETSARGGVYSRNGRRPPRRQEGRRSLDGTTPGASSQPRGRHSVEYQEPLSRAGINAESSNATTPKKPERRLSLDVRGSAKSEPIAVTRNRESFVGLGQANQCGDESKWIQRMHTADEVQKNNGMVFQRTRSRGSIGKLRSARVRRVSIDGSLTAMETKLPWDPSSFISSGSAPPSDEDLLVPEKRKAELRLVEPSGPNPLELPGPVLLAHNASHVTSGQAEAFLLKYTGDLKVSSALMLDGPTKGWPLTTLCLWIFRRHGVLVTMGIDDDRMTRYIRVIEEGYRRQNPYHNRAHAADVTMRMYSLLRRVVDLNAMPKEDSSQLLLSCILATAVHDYMHPGSNNQFQEEVSSEVAVIYNGKSTLEHFSASCALGIADEIGLFSGMSRQTAKQTRKDIIEMVLATDMSAHFDIVSSFGNVVAAKGGEGTICQSSDKAEDMSISDSFDFLSEPHGTRILILKVAIKLSDLGHCLLPWEEHMSWCERLEAEFFTQGDAERSESLDVSPLMDRNDSGVCDHHNSVGFFQMFVIPMLELWTGLFPTCTPILKQASANLEDHQRIMKRQQAEKRSVSVSSFE